MLSRQRSDESDGPPAGASTGGSLSLAAVDRDLPVKVLDVLGDDAISARLLEMGVVPGTIVTVIGAALAGDPIELDVRNYRLTVRRREAERVLVAPASE